MTQFKIILFPIFLSLVSLQLIGQDLVSLDSTTLTKNELVTGIQVPWELKWGPDDYLWFTQRNGKVFRTNPTTGNTSEILDHRSFVANEDDNGVGSEYGMLGMCFHPDFENNPLVYIAYNSLPDLTERLVSFEWDGNILKNEKVILGDIEGGIYHNGSRLLMTKDEKILMSTGDLTVPQNGQRMTTLNGKYLRINLDGSIPSDNPFPDSYIFSFGHRNSQGICYGPNDKLYISEHGTTVSDELSILEPGGNYGWANVLGYCDTTVEINFCEANNVIEPIFDWSPCVAVSDVAYYDHEAIPEWKGKLLVSVLGGLFDKVPRISVMTFNEDGTEIVSEEKYFEDLGRLRDVCFNPHTGSIYIATNGNSYPGFGPNQIIEYSNLEFEGPSNLSNLESQNISISPNPANQDLTIKSSEKIIGADYDIISSRGEIVMSGNIEQDSQTINISRLANGQYFIRCKNKYGQISRTFSIIK